MSHNEMKLIMENWREYCHGIDESTISVPALPAAGIIVTKQVIDGMMEMWKQYQTMKDPECRKDPEAKCGWRYSDKYFHCVAHCLSSMHGWGGKTISEIFGTAREMTDIIRKGDSDEAVSRDLIANNFGRIAAESGHCGECWKYIPAGLPELLWIVPGGKITDAHRSAVAKNTECNRDFMKMQGEEMPEHCRLKYVTY